MVGRELINILPHSTGGGGFQVPFLNGALVNVSDAPGGYIISCGCGAGKTEACKSIIRQYYRQGILYAVDSISEATRMYDWIKQQLIDTEHLLKVDDVHMIHSQVDISYYQKHPEEITKAKVLIITHVRLFSDIIDYYLTYDLNGGLLPAFNGDFQKLMQRPNIRRYILIDETPMFLKPFGSISSVQLGCLSSPVGTTWQLLPGKGMERAYGRFIKGTSAAWYKTGTAVDTLKEKMMFELIKKQWPAWIKGSPKDNMDFYFYPSDLVQQGMKSHLIIFEGVADCLLRTAKGFTLLDHKQKYNSTMLFKEFGFSLKRNSYSPQESEIADFVQSLTQILSATNGKTLIVVWKNFHGDTQVDGNQTGVSEWRDTVEERLSVCGFKDFSVTYYGATDTKSTNRYSDYQNIILAGKWGIKNPGKLNEAYNARMTGEDLCFWYFVQLLSRIGIRQHKGGTYNCFYSSDTNPYLVASLKEYINNNKLQVHQSKASMKKNRVLDLWERKVDAISGGNRHLDMIKYLFILDLNIKTAIEKGNAYTCKIKLDDLYRVCPKEKKKRARPYSRMLGFLKLLHIDITLV